MHIKFNGIQCLQPVMRHKKYCHFHNFLYERNEMPGAERFQIPIAEDTPSIQIAIIQIMRALICHGIDTKTAGVLLYALQLSTSNISRERDVFPPPPPEEEEIEQPPSLAQILLAKLRDDNPCSFTEEEHQRIFHQPHPSFPGYPKMPVPDGMVAAEEDEEEGPGDSHQAPENVEA